MIGIFQRPGIIDWPSFVVILKMPPMTAVPPSRTMRRVLASRVVSGMFWPPAMLMPTAGSLFWTVTSMMTVPSFVIWGVTSRRSVALM